MNFGLTKEQELVKQMAAEFVKNEVEPLAKEVDATEKYPIETMKKMAIEKWLYLKQE